MTQSPRTCVYCGAPLQREARFCQRCGRYVEAEEDVVLLSGALRVRDGALDTRELLGLVETGLAYWRMRLESASAPSRGQAAAALGELSRILQSLAAQLAQGRTTVRITTRLPVARAYLMGCPVCGRGNRQGARFCQHCGAALTTTPAKRSTMVKAAWTFSISALSDVGRVRALNEDTCYVGTLTLPQGEELHLCLVADGMGGAQAGEEASRLAADAVRQAVERAVGVQVPTSDEAWQALLREAASSANGTVYREAQAHSAQRGMGTTLTVALLVGDHAHIAQVGDSRAYLFNRSGLSADGAVAAQLTNDHSLVARLVDIGQITAEEARNHPQRNLLYRSLGTDPAVDIDTHTQALQEGDRLLLCSDGLTNHVEDDELAQIVLEQSAPDAICAKLVALANERGGRDNISAIVVQVLTAD